MVRAVRLAGWGLFGATFGAVGVWAVLQTSWVGAVIGAAVGAALLVGGVLLEWRRAGGWAIAVAVPRAARTGELPDDADPRRWVPALERYARDLRSARWRYPVIVVPLLIGFESGRGASIPATAFFLSVIAIELGATVDALVRAPGVTRRVEAMTGRLAARWSEELRAPA